MPALGLSAVQGLAALDHEEDASEHAVACRQVIWSQPEDIPGIVVDFEPVTVVAAHAGPQDFASPGLAVAFLARHFAATGDDASLEAAIELHDLCVALGDDLWESVECGPLGLGAAELYLVTGDPAFLATAERAADVLCEAHRPDCHIGPDAASTARALFALEAMATAVEDRMSAELDVDDEVDAGDATD